MIRWLNIAGAQYNDTHAQHGQRPYEWGPPQWMVFGNERNGFACKFT